jgi:D-alanine-D-alanine ligase
MIVGLTYDLRSAYLKMGYSKEETAEFDREDTIEAIETTLNELGFKTVRIGNLMELIHQLNQGQRWDIVFNICEGMHGIGREAQVPALLEAFRIPFVFSDSVSLSVTLHKAMTKRIVRDAGIATPDFFVVRDEQDISQCSLPFPLFAKPNAEGTGKGIGKLSLIHTPEELRETCLNLLDAFKQPVLVEEFLPGREFTAGITGSGKNAEVTGVMEILLQNEAEKGSYTYTNKAEYEKLVQYKPVEGPLADEVAKLSLEAYHVLECLDGGRVDIRLDKTGNPQFIEVNPLAGLHPIHSDLPILCRFNGITYKDLMERIMRSALQRYGFPFPEPDHDGLQ